MNTQVKIAALMLVTALPLVSHAAEPIAEVEHYSYGQALDVKEVVSVKALQPDSTCGVIEKKMTYKDSQGEAHEMIYEAVASGCQNG